MIDDRPLVHLRLRSTPETLTLVRGMLGALADLLTIDAELLDDIKTAISEACNNVVMHAYGDQPGPLEVALFVSPDALRATVLDEGGGIPDVVDADEGVHGVGLPLIKALADDAVEFLDRPGGGTEVRMTFRIRGADRRPFTAPEAIAPEDGWVERLTGDAVVSLSPVSVLGPVLGRLARALAARARFSLDRFSDVYLVTDAIAAHMTKAARRPRVGFSIRTDPRRMEITVGPVHDGSGAGLTVRRAVHEPGSALALLSDELESRPSAGGEMLRVVMTDGPSRSTARHPA